MFREVNDHLRATEQKHLQVSVGFISVTVLALSFLVPNKVASGGWASFLTSWPTAFALLVLVLAGSATMFAQHVFRGWKKEYLLASKKLVYGWPIEDEVRINWMRTDRGPYAHADRSFFRLAGDNVLFWFVTIITSCIAAALFFSIGKLLKEEWPAWLVTALGGVAYITMFSYITTGAVRRKEVLENEWDEFVGQRNRDEPRP